MANMRTCRTRAFCESPQNPLSDRRMRQAYFAKRVLASTRVSRLSKSKVDAGTSSASSRSANDRQQHRTVRTGRPSGLTHGPGSKDSLVAAVQDATSGAVVM